MTAFEGPIAYYAFGGGLGHLVRARAVCATLDLPKPCATFTASPLAADPAFAEALHPWVAPADLQNDVRAFRAWLGDCLERLAPRWLFVDAFPAGILGELCDFPFPRKLRLAHVARILRWQPYEELVSGKMPTYEQVLAVERLADDHRDRLGQLSSTIENLELRDPPSSVPTATVTEIVRRWKHSQKPVWLVVHSGPDEETQELLDYAREHAASGGAAPSFVVASATEPSRLPPDATWLRVYPACDLFPFADKIVTAGGFNSIRQTNPWRSRHLALPLPRRFDDQFLRCRWLREVQ